VKKDFFKKGFSQGAIPKTDADRLLGLVKTENFKVSGAYAEDPDINPPETVYQPSAALLEECRAWSNYSILSSIQKCFGVFSYWFCTVNRFSHSRGMMWHNDHIDGNFLTLLIYLTETDWRQDLGGCLEIGKVKEAGTLIEPRLKPSDYHLVEKTATVVPMHGTTVIMNNLTLPFCHRVTPTTTDQIRYTVMFHFGYWENTQEARKNFGFEEKIGKEIKEGS
jgi:hypothetical protein